MKQKNTSAQNTILIAYIGKKYEYKYAIGDYYYRLKTTLTMIYNAILLLDDDRLF
jgi:hypothetical protein